MKFVHIADLHFDSPFVNLSSKENLGELRRLEQRKALKTIVEYIKENKIEYLFISGDLYEHKYVKRATIEFINQQFKEIPYTKIFISPGNHDPYLKNSYYNTFNWNNNVKIFNSKFEKIKTDEADIYGYGFNEFYCKKCDIENLEIDNKEKVNILVIHGSLNGGNVQELEYNPLNKKELKEKKFDYIALGHIHKLDYNEEENQNIVYPGSTISLGFDEPGKHGMIVGELNKGKINLEFIPIDEKEFKIQEIDVTEINFSEELVEKINELEIKESNLVEIVLVGRRNFEINIYNLRKLITNSRVIKVKDKTKINYDLEKLSNETTLKGLFVKEMNEKLKSEDLSEEDKKIIEKAIEIGLDALE